MISIVCVLFFVFFFKQKTAYDMRISDGVQTCALPICGRGSRRAAGDGGRGDEAKQEFLHGTDFPGIEVSVVRQRGSTTRQCRPASSSMQAIRLLIACAPIAAHSVPVRR